MGKVYPLKQAERIAIDLEAWKLMSVPGVELIRLLFRSGEELPAHHNPSEVVFHVLKGMGELSIDNQSFELGSGDSAHVLPDAMRSWKNTGPDALEILVIKRQ